MSINLYTIKKFIQYFYKFCLVLFFIVKLNGKIIVGMWESVKPFGNGNKAYWKHTQMIKRVCIA